MKTCNIYKQIVFYLLAASLLFPACSTIEKGMDSKMKNITFQIKNLINSKKGVYAVAYKDLQSGEIILINEQEYFHAASTMKTPVMIEVFKQIQEGKFGLNDSIEIKNSFKSIVDGSSFSIELGDDSDKEIYKLIGSKTTVYNLIYNMITISSNLATNILIEKVKAENVTNTMRTLGASKIKVLRGVEDSKAYNAGLNNMTTAYDLMVIFEHLAKKDLLSETSHENMLKILLDQKFKDKIAAPLPSTLKVANKTGSISNVEHDSGIVYLPDGRKYVLVLLSKELPDSKTGIETLAQISKIIYDGIYSIN